MNAGDSVVPCLWFVTQDSDILMRFDDDMSCLYGRCVSLRPL
jgi:hypothetical protein